MNICDKFFLSNCTDKKYINSIFLNNKLVLLVKSSKYITVLDLRSCCEHKVDACHEYTCITSGCNKIFLIRKDDNDTIYIANGCFKEVDKICLHIPKQYQGTIISIAFDVEKERFYICNGKTVFSTTYDGYFIKEELSKETLNCINTKTSSTVATKDLCCNVVYKNVDNYKLSITCVAIFCGQLFVAYNKNNSSYIARISSNGNIINEYYIGDNIVINSIFKTFFDMSFLVTVKDSYNYLYITDYKCCKKNHHHYNNDCECLGNLGDNNLDCHEHHNCHDKCDLDNSKCHIVDTIAKMEASLSHILNAEGEKIQRAVKDAKCCEDLLKVNDSVSNTIKDVSMLEHILYNKLDLALTDDKCCKCKDKCKHENDCKCKDQWK